MKKRFTLGTVLALMLPVAVLAAIIAYSIVDQAFREKTESVSRQQQEFAKYSDARRKILDSFVGPADDSQLEDGAIRGMVASLNDKYSHYLTAEEYEAYKGNMGSQSASIGVTACMSPEEDILVAEVYDGSPALEKGVERLDRIVAVDGRPVSEMGYQLAVSALSGEENTKVNITLLKASDGSQTELTLVRRNMDVRAVTSTILDGQNIGLVRIRDFQQSAVQDFRALVVQLLNARVDALIFDVRNNPGGQVDAMCSMLSMLLPKGEPLITLRYKNGQEEPYASEGPGETDIPMVVLINENSYSAAEFFAAVLQEYGKAVLVGEPTTGKGYAQKDIPLEDGSAVILSISEYFTPNGRSLSGVGLTPDYPVSLSPDAARHFGQVPHEQDSQLQKAIEVLTPLLPAEDN